MATTSTDMSPARREGFGGDAAGPGPARVLQVDVDDLRPVDCSHPEGGLYSALWVLALRLGQPLGMVEIEVSGAEISADELEDALREKLGEAWQRQVEEPPPALSLPPATVVVPTNVGRPEQLLRCASRLSELDYPDFEVIVVDNRGAGTRGEEVIEALGALANVRVLAEPRPGISAARNGGLAVARGEIIAFTDDDVEVDRGWLKALGGRFLSEPAADAVTGLLIPKELETPAQIWLERSGSWLDRAYEPLSFELAARRRPRSGGLSGDRFRVIRRTLTDGRESTNSLYATGEFGNGANMSFRTEALRSLGGFDEALGTGTPTFGGEDLAALIELLSSGRLLAYEPTAIVHHTNRRTLEELERQIGGYAIGLTAMLSALIWRDPRHLAGLLGMLPTALRSTLSGSSSKQSYGGEGYPSELARAEVGGLLSGPLAYARSRRAQRRWRA
jgi:hypothetical protein